MGAFDYHSPNILSGDKRAGKNEISLAFFESLLISIFCFLVQFGGYALIVLQDVQNIE